MWFLLAISVPVFYIIGIIAFVRWIFHPKTTINSREDYLKAAIADLSEKVAESPNKKLSKQLEDYNQELFILTGNQPGQSLALQNPNDVKLSSNEVSQEKIISEEVVTTTTTAAQVGPENKAASVDLGEVWENWYSDNSINLLLYIGAFLIIASASIFVGFNWATLNGSAKAMVLTLLNLAFFGFGVWFYNLQKIKTAGATFIAIGALLIPFSGLAWYNFVLEPAGVSAGIVWLLISLLSVAVYSLLAYFIRHPFYTYIAGFGGLSTALAGVNTLSLSREFYVLAGICFAFLLLLITRVFNQPKAETKQKFATPLLISAHVIMPIFLLWGLSLAAASDKLFSLEVVFASLIATFYYLTAYTFSRETSFLQIAQILSVIFVFLAGRHFEIATEVIFNLIEALLVVYLGLCFVLKNRWQKEAEAISLASQVVFPAVLALQFFSQGYDFSFNLSLTFAAAAGTIFYSLSYFVYRQSAFLLLAEFFVAGTLFVGGKWIEISTNHLLILIEVLAIAYLGLFYKLKGQFVEEAKSFFASANIIIFTSVSLLAAFSLQETDIFTKELSVGLALAVTFYIASYLVSNNLYSLVAAEVLFPVTLFVGGKYFNLRDIEIFYLIEVVISSYLGMAYLVKKTRDQASDTLLVASLAFAALIFIGSVNNFAALHGTIFAAWAAVLGLAAVYVKREITFLYYNIIFLAISTYWYFGKLLNLEDKIHLIGLAYVGISVIFYLVAVYSRNKVSEKFSFAFIHAALLNIVIGSYFTLTEAKYFAAANIVAAAIALDAAIRFKKPLLIYLSNLLFALTTWSLLRSFKTDLVYYPFAFAVLAYVFYSVSFVVSKELERFYRFSGLVGAGVNTLVFGIFGRSAYQNTYYDYTSGQYITENHYVGLERNALITSYATVVLYSVEAYLNKINFFGYFASAVGMVTYLWQVNYLGITETQVYTLPLGAYFMSLAYLQKRAGRSDYKDLLDYVGLGFLLVPTLFQAFGANDTARYALLLGAEGVVLIFVGISLQYRNYLYIGIAALALAIVSQTYETVLSLPRWIIVGTVGIGFLAVAIYLLLKRQEEPKK